jgi:glycosyltransferase involved in cell wall biosynthesis
MRVAVYNISKNEEQFIERWAESAKDADIIVLLDTGSTDNTVKLAKSLGVHVVETKVEPWRFDIARNLSLDAVPEDIDYCIALDVDEVLLPGWREGLEKAFAAEITRPRYKYVWSWNADGSEGLTYGGDKIHARKDYQWKHPVHEVIGSTTGHETQQWYAEIEIHHFPDHTKSRGQYFPLLELSVQEDPDDDRNAYYYARELYFHRHKDDNHEKAINEFKRHLNLPRALWRPERARGMRYLAELELGERETWLLRACGEAPDRREGWVELSLYYHDQQRWEACLSCAVRALEIKEKPLEYLCEEPAWGGLPWDLAAVSAFNLGLANRAVEYGEVAVSHEPDNKRLTGNLEIYRKHK